MGQHLSKEEELHLGGKIQASIRAREALELDTAAKLIVVDGVSLPVRKVIREGEAALAALLDANSGLVWSRARAFKTKYPASPPVEDLAQEGFVGLMRAAHKYDPAMGNKFSTVAFYWIEQSISRSVNQTHRLVRLPENRVQDYMEITKRRSFYEDSGLNQDEIDNSIMQELKLTRAEFMDITAAASNHASLNKPVSSDGSDAKEFIDIVSANHVTDGSDELVMKRAIFGLLNDKLDEMTELEKDIVGSSFMADGLAARRLSQKEVREKYGISPQKFKRLLKDTLGKLNDELTELGVGFQDFLE